MALTSHDSHRPLPWLRLVVVACLCFGLSACGRSVDTASLLPLMDTDLSRFEEPIRAQLNQERSRVESLLADPPAAPELARAVGQLGRSYHAYGLHPPASICYRNALTLAPEDPRWHYLLAVIEQADGALEEAAAHLEEARRRMQNQADDGDDSAAVILAMDLRLATIYSDLNRSDDAAALLRQVLADDDGVAAAHFHLGRLAAARGETGQAVERFERTLELQPQATTVHYVLGVAYRRLGDEASAQRHMDDMGAVPPSFPDPWVEALEDLVLGVGPMLDRAQEAVESGRFEEAKREYGAALELEPDNATALRGMGYTLRKAGEYGASVKALRDMLKIYPKDTAAHLELATTLLEDGQLDASIDEFDRLLEIDPEFEQAYLNQGVALSQQGRWRDAMERFQKVLEIDPKDRTARFHMAVALDATGRSAESMQRLKDLAMEFPLWVEVHQRLGLELLKQGNPDAATGHHQAVLDIADAPAEEKALAHYQLAQIAEQRQDLDGALHHYSRARELFPGLWQAALSYGNSLRRAGRFSEAAVQYRFLVEGEPSNVHHRVLEIQALMQAADDATAARRLEEGLQQLPRAAELGHLKARLLATAHDSRLRNGELAYDMAKQIFDVFPSLEHGETVAMALAERGDFGAALNLQQRLMEEAEAAGRADVLLRLRRNFDRYRRGEPARGW